MNPVLPSVYWPTKEPESVVAVTFPVTDNGTDTITSATIATRPSGTGELTVTSFSVTSNVVTARVSGGVAGRSYIHKLLCTTQGGLTYEYLIGQVCDAVLAASPIPPSPSPDFGTVRTWP